MKKAKVALVSMLMLAGSGMYAQTNGIGGTVTDNTGEPIIGASVKVKGSSNMGTVTDIDGNFKLNVKPGETLIILKSASNLNGNLNCSKELEHYAS